MASKGPKLLTDDDLSLLNRLIKSCEETSILLSKCEACSLDVSPERERNTDQLETAKRIKQHFFPNAK